MPDNLANFGIEDDTPRRRGKKRGRRKPFVLQARFVRGPDRRPSTGLTWLFRSLEHWYTHSRYRTESARDQAYAALVKKAENDPFQGWSKQEFRKL